MPDLPDVALLRTHSELIEDHGWTFAGPGDAPWDDHSYLRPEELANPDIAASVKSMTEANTMIRFVLVHEDGEYLGYWLGPDGSAAEQAAVVRLDNEGQYSIVAGCIAGGVADGTWDEDKDELLRAYAAKGITLRPTPEVTVDPDEWRDQRYEALLA